MKFSSNVLSDSFLFVVGTMSPKPMVLNDMKQK